MELVDDDYGLNILFRKTKRDILWHDNFKLKRFVRKKCRDCGCNLILVPLQPKNTNDLFWLNYTFLAPVSAVRYIYLIQTRF